MRDVDDVVDVGHGIVHVRIWNQRGDRPVVVLGNLDDNPRRSVTNVFDAAATRVAAKFLSGRERTADWYDYWPAREGLDEELDHVSMRIDGRRALQFASPEWSCIDIERLEQLVDEPIERYPAGTYTSDIVKRIAAEGAPIAVSWDPLQVEALAEAAVAVAELGKRFRTASHILARAAVAAESTEAAFVDEPPGLVAVRREPVRLPADIKRRVERLAENPRLRALAADAGHIRTLVQALRDELQARGPHLAAAMLPSQVGVTWEWPAATLPADDDTTDTSTTSLRTAESICTRAWHLIDPAAHDLEVPRVVVSAPCDAKLPLALRYLRTVSWWGPQSDHAARAAVLARHFGGDDGNWGYDPWGRLVLHRNTRFITEWPVAPPNVLHDRWIAEGNASTDGSSFVAVHWGDGRVEPLAASREPYPDPSFTWGYGGAGPRNLARALAELVRATATFIDVRAPDDLDERTQRMTQRRRAQARWTMNDFL